MAEIDTQYNPEQVAADEVRVKRALESKDPEAMSKLAKQMSSEE